MPVDLAKAYDSYRDSSNILRNNINNFLLWMTRADARHLDCNRVTYLSYLSNLHLIEYTISENDVDLRLENISRDTESHRFNLDDIHAVINSEGEAQKKAIKDIAARWCKEITDYEEEQAKISQNQEIKSQEQRLFRLADKLGYTVTKNP